MVSVYTTVLIIPILKLSVTILPLMNNIYIKANQQGVAAIVTGIFIIASLFNTEAKAQGNLLIMPKRVVFEGPKRSEEINLANTGSDTATYVISFVQMRMTETGAFEKILEPDSAQNFSDKNVRFFPRMVTLAPNEAQSVKVQVTKSGELKPGEYRSHLYFRAIPKEKPLGEKVVTNDTSISVSLVPVFGISIPVIIRVGENDTKVSFSDVALNTYEDTIPAVSVTFNRSGKMSAYGDVVVEHISPIGVKTRVGMIKGIAVYTPNPVRKSQIKLNNVPGVDFHTGKLQVMYTDQSINAKSFAEQEILLR